MKTIREWQKIAYDNAVAKGFHACKACDGKQRSAHDPEATCEVCLGTGVAPMTPTRLGARLALIHCEISEAVECVARGKMELWFPSHTVKYTDGVPSEPYESDALAGRSGDMERASKLVFMGFKPEGFPIELADVFIRLCDLAESVGEDIVLLNNGTRLGECETSEEIANELERLHRLVSKLRQAPNGYMFSRVYTRLHFLAVWTHVDLLAMAELKHQYNLTRPIMHGGKVL